MTIVIIGYGTQGKKRHSVLKKKKKKILIVDPIYIHANAKKIEDIKEYYSHAFVCTPDNIKLKIISYLLEKNIKILVEKPLYLKKKADYKFIVNLLKKYRKSQIYVAYNHRFEPNIQRLKKYISKEKIGNIFLIEMYYGNGTSKLWQQSNWRRNDNKGVVLDLGVHLLDIYLYLFGKMPNKNVFFINSKNENKNIDYAVFGSVKNNLTLKFTTSLIDWKNKFEINIIGEKGSIHVNNLCKWGDSIFTYRKRKLPSGIPVEKVIIEKKGDPTWSKEHKYFFNSNKISNYNNDLEIKKYIDNIF